MKTSTKAAIARVTAGPLARESIGTAFLVSERYLLTALHVVGDRSAFYGGTERFFEPITLLFEGSTRPATAQVVKDCWDVHDDWALLEIDQAPLNVRPIPLANLPDGATPEFKSFGFPVEHGSLAVEGKVRDVAASYFDAKALQLFCEELAAGGSPLNGLSGAPCLVSGYAVGVVRAHPVKKELIGTSGSITAKNGVLYACSLSQIVSSSRNLVPSPIDLSHEALKRIIYAQEKPARHPTPQDFTSYLAEKREGFVAREWLFNQVSDWTKGGEKRSLLIVGDPGFGKSAIVAEMIERREAMGVIGWFCCRWDYPDQLTPRVFVEAITASLAENLPSYSVALKTSKLQDLLEKAQTGTQVGPRTLFEQLMLGPLLKLRDSPSTPRLIVIDALDESLSVPQGIVDLLADTLHQWPKWLRIVATSRAYPEVLAKLRGMQATILKADDADNKADLAAYVEANLQLRSAGNKHIANDSRYSYVLEAAQGNFLIAKALIGEMHAGHLHLEELNSIKLNGGTSRLPLGLQLFYERSFARLFPTDQDFAPARTVLALALAALEPLDLPILKAASGIEKGKLGSILKKLASFLPLRSDKHFVFFHKSVHDWLDAATVDEYEDPVAGRFAIDIQVGRRLLVEWAGRISQTDYSRAPRYVLRHLATHLIELGNTDTLRNLLFDFNWLSIKLQQIGIQAVLEDFERLPSSLAEERPLQLLHRTLQMVAHILIHSPEQLAPQLLGRLREDVSPEFASLCEGSRRWRGAVWLLPLHAHMRPPGVMLQVLEGHGHIVRSVAFSPDSTRIVSGSLDHMVRLWDAKSGQPIGGPMEGHKDFVLSVAFSPDGSRIVSCGFDGTLRLWDAKTAQPIGVPLEGHEDIVTSVAFSPDGTRIVSGSHHGALRLWDAGSRQPIGIQLRGHGSGVTSVAFSPDGTCIVSGSIDRTLRLWDASSGEHIGSPLEGHEDTVRSAAFSPDGTLIVSASNDGTLRLWDATSGRLRGQPLEGHDDWVTSVAFSPDGTRIVSGSRTLRLWDATSGRPIGTPLGGHGGLITSVAFSPDGRRIVSGSNDRTLRLWDSTSVQPMGVPFEGHGDIVRSVAFSPDGTRIVSGSTDGTLRLWDATSGQPVGVPLEGHRDMVRSAAFSPDSTRLVSGSNDRTLRQWDARSGEPIGAPLKGHGQVVTSVSFSPDGTRIVSGSNDGELRLWDAGSGQPIGIQPRGHESGVTSVAFSPDGTRIVSGSTDQTLRQWDARSGEPIGIPLEGNEDIVTSVAFNPNGRLIVSGSYDGTLRLWDAISSQPTGVQLRGHKDQVGSVAFSPDGARIVSGSDDRTLRLWDLETGNEVVELGLDSGVLSVTWRCDGVAAGEANGAVHVFCIIKPDG